MVEGQRSREREGGRERERGREVERERGREVEREGERERVERETHTTQTCMVLVRTSSSCSSSILRGSR